MATIIIKNSTGVGVTPTSLQQGELAINTKDGRLFYGSGSGNIVKEFTSSGSSISASYALTASYATNGGVTQLLAGANISISPTTGVGQVTISSTGGGGGGFNTATGSYGSFYDTTTQTNVAGTARSMSLNTTDITNGVSVSGSTNPFNTYIKVENAGVYNIQFSAQVDKTDSGTDEIWIWIRKNGTSLTDTATSVQLQGNGAHYVAAWNFFVNAAAGDYFQLMWYSPDANVRLHAEPAFGVVPGIPSLIVTANRVDQFLSNTGSFSGSFTGSLFGTASWATNALTASFINTASTNAFVQNGNSFGTTALLGTNDNQSLAFETSGSVRMFVSSSGNVGIGTSTPITQLDVSGSGRFTSNLTVTGSLLVSNSTTQLVGPSHNVRASTGDINLFATASGVNIQTSQINVYDPASTVGVSDHIYIEANTGDGGIYWSNAGEVISSYNTTTGRYIYGNNNLYVSSSDSRTYSPSGFVGPLTGTASYAATASLLTGRLSTYRSFGTGSMVGTGSTSLTATTSFLIPSNTFTTGDILRVRYRVRKLATGGNTTTGIYINTTNDISTATTLGILTGNTTSMQMKRDFYILAATGINTEHVGVGTSLATDDVATGRAASTINWAVDQYMIFGIQHTNTGDSGYSTMYYLERV